MCNGGSDAAMDTTVLLLYVSAEIDPVITASARRAPPPRHKLEPKAAAKARAAANPTKGQLILIRDPTSVQTILAFSATVTYDLTTLLRGHLGFESNSPIAAIPQLPQFPRSPIPRLGTEGWMGLPNSPIPRLGTEGWMGPGPPGGGPAFHCKPASRPGGYF